MDREGLRDLLILLLIATALRVYSSSGLGIDHFDEGAYAMTSDAVARGAWAPLAYPFQHYLSPPLFAVLSGVTMRLVGRSEFVMFGISIVAGIATVGLVYLVGRRWFGRIAGVTAAIIVCLSDYHILYSRAGLTDALFAPLLLAAIVCFEKAQSDKGFGWTIAAGIATGLAWNTKHHGWLAFIVAIAATLPRLWQGQGKELRPIVTRLAVAGAIALVIYLPWLIHVNSQPGGYLALAREHSRFVDPTALIQNTVGHMQFQLFLEGWATRTAPLAAAGWLVAISPQEKRNGIALLGLLLFSAGFVIGSTVVIAALALTGIVILWRSRDERSGFIWFPIAFFAVFSMLTPFFQAHSRLLVPWLIAAALLAGLAVDNLVARVWQLSSAWVAVILTGVSALTVSRLVSGFDPALPWRERDGFRNAAAAMIRVTNASLPVLVIGEPALVHYLRQEGREAWHVHRPHDAGSYIRDGQSYYLVGGIYSRRIRGRDSLKDWLLVHPEANQTGTVPVAGVSDVRLLDDFNPVDGRRFRRERRNDYELRVYEVRSP